LRTIPLVVLAVATLAGPLSGCAETRLIKPGASLEQVEEDRAACRRQAALTPRPPAPEPPPTFNASSAPLQMGSANDVSRVGNAQMSDVMDRTSVDEAMFENCLRARGFQDQ
jgi:hypothetical protein